MAKRFTDTDKWKKQFFKGLSTVHKLFFVYLLDACDHAGIWHVEPEVASLRVGEDIDITGAKKALGKHIVEFDGGEKWFIPYFVGFQYGELNESVNAHRSVIGRLKKYGLLKKFQQFNNPSSRVKDKDKDKDQDKDKENLSTNAFALTAKFIHTLDKRPAEDVVKKWGVEFDRLMSKGYLFHQLQNIIVQFRADDFWRSNFLSPLKLWRKNPDGVRYIDVFVEKLKPTTDKPDPGPGYNPQLERDVKKIMDGDQ